jgi:hypothetical protein
MQPETTSAINTGGTYMSHAPPPSPVWDHGGVTGRALLLVARRHIDLALVSSAVCRPAR